jgi:ABC-type microcin C transport system duplicated ATPase subunit YejF
LFSLVGESGSGKSTIARCIVQLTGPTDGPISLSGTDVTGLSRSAFRPRRARVQVVFQDPSGSLNPRMRTGELVEEPLTSLSR